MQRKMIIDPDHLSVLARQQLLDVVEKRAYSGVVSSHSWSTPDAIPRILRLGGVVDADGRLDDRVPAAVPGDQAAARPALLLGHRLGRGHERLRAPGRPAQGRRRDLPVQVLRRQADDRQAAQRPARLRHQRRRRRPLRPVPRLGRGPAPHRRPGGRRRPRPRRRGLPADVGARRRRAADPLPAREGARDAPRPHPRAARRERRRAAAPRGPAAHARAHVDLVHRRRQARRRITAVLTRRRPRDDGRLHRAGPHARRRRAAATGSPSGRRRARSRSAAGCASASSAAAGARCCACARARCAGWPCTSATTRSRRAPRGAAAAGLR